MLARQVIVLNRNAHGDAGRALTAVRSVQVVTTAPEPDFGQFAVKVVIKVGFRIGKQSDSVIAGQITALM